MGQQVPGQGLAGVGYFTGLSAPDAPAALARARTGRGSRSVVLHLVPPPLSCLR